MRYASWPFPHPPDTPRHANTVTKSVSSFTTISTRNTSTKVDPACLPKNKPRELPPPNRLVSLDLPGTAGGPDPDLGQKSWGWHSPRTFVRTESCRTRSHERPAGRTSEAKSKPNAEGVWMVYVRKSIILHYGRLFACNTWGMLRSVWNQ